MAYHEFTLRGAIDSLGLIEGSGDLFGNAPAVEPSARLSGWLARHVVDAVFVNSELARSCLIITPVLSEAQERAKGPARLLPGLTLDVDRSRGLNGYCDYVLARWTGGYTLRGPLVAVIEAKKEDIMGGLGQCAASMVAIRDFNERDGTPLPAVYGAVTSGTNWLFLRLTGPELTIDTTEYYISDAGKIVGILVHILGG